MAKRKLRTKKGSRRVAARTAASSRSPRSCSRPRLHFAGRSNPRPTTGPFWRLSSCSCASCRCDMTAGVRSSRRLSRIKTTIITATKPPSTTPTSTVARARFRHSRICALGELAQGGPSRRHQSEAGRRPRSRSTQYPDKLKVLLSRIHAGSIMDAVSVRGLINLFSKAIFEAEQTREDAAIHLQVA